MVKEIKISDFDYNLPDERIARHPLEVRDACKLLVSAADGGVRHEVFSSLPELIPSDALLVFNDTRVINARITFEKITGSRIEVFLLDPLDPHDYVQMFQAKGRCRWKCLVGNLKRWKSGPLSKTLEIDGRNVILSATLEGDADGNSKIVAFSWDSDDTFASVVDAAGYIPIPPYLKRASEKCDADDYQTVYSRVKGSVAAPTAGLHFTESVLENLREKGVDIERLTLHVGAGTFQPVKSETIGDHPMHTEVFTIDRCLIDSLITALREKRTVVAVGTTSVRTLESLPYLGAALAAGCESPVVGQWWPYGEFPYDNSLLEDTVGSLEAIRDYMEKSGQGSLTASTAIMIAPGFRWRIVDMMVTNFHQPQSTLLLLVSSFLNRNVETETPRWRKLYDEALSLDYRFLSYGDACLLSPLVSVS